MRIADFIPRGSYQAEVVARDDRGAQSLSVVKKNIVSRERPLFMIGKWGISATFFYLTVIVIIICGTIGVVLAVRKMGAKRGLKSFIIKRDMINSFTSLKKDLDDAMKTADKNESGKEASYRMAKIKEKIEKSSKYLSEEVEELGKDK